MRLCECSKWRRNDGHQFLTPYKSIRWTALIINSSGCMMYPLWAQLLLRHGWNRVFSASDWQHPGPSSSVPDRAETESLMWAFTTTVYRVSKPHLKLGYSFYNYTYLILETYKPMGLCTLFKILFIKAAKIPIFSMISCHGPWCCCGRVLADGMEPYSR